MHLITELNEDVEYVTEEGKDGKKALYIQGPFMMAEVKNKNGRIYPKEVLMKEIKRYNESYTKMVGDVTNVGERELLKKVHGKSVKEFNNWFLYSKK